jgi:hypothetical protein
MVRSTNQPARSGRGANRTSESSLGFSTSSKVVSKKEQDEANLKNAKLNLERCVSLAQL